MMERGEDDDESDQLQLMTLHAPKGLEFPHIVFNRYGRGDFAASN